MCNFINITDSSMMHKKIPESGHGYKWMCKYRRFYKAPFKGGVFKIGLVYIWDDILYKGDGDGFTFFRSKKEAMKARTSMYIALFKNNRQDIVLVKIKYGKGLISRLEFDPAIEARICLCKQLTFIEEVSITRR